MAKKEEHKPLSFSTTMRNPERIAAFLSCLKEFEKMILTNDLIDKIVKKIIKNKLYEPYYISRNKNLKEISKSEETYTENQLEDIISNSPQKHKEAGFDKGWPSRFDTWYKISKEFGFLYYEMNKNIEISETGHMLCEAYENINDNLANEKIQNIFLNALTKYQTNNPFRKNANKNAPIMLLLNLLKLLKKDSEENGAGLHRKELSFIICWPNNNYIDLYKFIKNFRKTYKFSASDEIIYKTCLTLLNSENEKRFKMKQIVKEATDDLIRKLRITGIFSLRGMGRFIDLNTFQIEKIDYIISKYTDYKTFNNELEYFEYMGHIDSQIINLVSNIPISTVEKIKVDALKKFSSEYSIQTISNELDILSSKKPSKDLFLADIDQPTRLEFLTSLILVKIFPNAFVKPNYSIDDEGIPTFTARGGVADIEFYDNNTDSLIEVTMMQNRSQASTEIPSITRHLKEFKNNSKKQIVFSLFIAPSIHEDTNYMCDFSKVRDKVDIIPISIKDFILHISTVKNISDFIMHK